MLEREGRMTGPHLIYFADPMCSWCWGFSPVVDALRERFGSALPVRLIMGGLRPGTTQPLNENSKREIREHWEHVHEASGQPFDLRFFDREGFVYDTEPASRAIVVVRRGGMGEALDFLKQVHAAFYAHNQDVTNEAILADLAAERGHSRDGFLQALRSNEAQQETWQDFAIAQKAGIRGFPCLIAGAGEGAEYSIVTMGYQPADRILPPLEKWLELLHQSQHLDPGAGQRTS
jgi:putative protein-disulfide isomerase